MNQHQDRNSKQQQQQPPPLPPLPSRARTRLSDAARRQVVVGAGSTMLFALGLLQKERGRGGRGGAWAIEEEEGNEGGMGYWSPRARRWCSR